jgi:spermidine synthase
MADDPREMREVHKPGTRRSMLQFAGGAAASFLFSRGASPQAKELVRESVFNYIIISREGSVVSFRRMENGAKVSAVDLTKPAYQIIPYTKYLFAASLANSGPANVLSIGLGAGSFNRLFNLGYPKASLTTVEIDQMILDVAVEYTDFKEGDNNKVVINDGRRYLRRNNDRWDWIVIDAFVKNSQYPPHMATREFFEIVADRLTDNGVLAINILHGNRLFDCMIATIKTVFASHILFDVPESANAIVLAAMSANPSLEQKIKAALPGQLSLMKDNGVDLLQMRGAGATSTPIFCSTPLTDDFAPTEFLGAQWQR